MTGGERTEGVFIEKMGFAETKDAGKPRNAEDPIQTPEGAIKGIYTNNQIDYYVPYYTTHPGKKALEFFKNLTEKKKDNAEYWGRYAMSNFQMSDHKTAIESGSMAVSLNKKEPWALLALAFSHQAMYENEKSIKYFTELLDADLTSFKDWFVTKQFIYSNLAHSYMKLGKTKEAEESFKKAFDKSKTSDLIALKMYERFYCRTGQVDKAISLYTEILKTNPEDVNSLMNLGTLYIKKKEYDKAIEYLQKAHGLNDKIMKILFYIHWAYFKKDDMENSMKYLKKVMEFDIWEQKKLEYSLNDKISVYPSAGTIYSKAALAMGDFEKFIMMEKSFSKDEKENRQKPTFVHDELIDMQDSGEYSIEDTMKFYYDTHPSELFINRFIQSLHDVMTPATREGKALHQKCARYLINRKMKEAFETAEAGMELEPESLSFLLQAAIATTALENYDPLWKYFEILDKLKYDMEMNKTKEIARLFTRLGVMEQFLIKKFKIAGEDKWFRSELSSKITDEQLKTLARMYDESYEIFKNVNETTDSTMEKAFTSLILAYISSNTYQVIEGGEHYLTYLNFDNKLKMLRYLFSNYGRDYGY